MIEGSGKKFDPILLKIFITMMGNYPVGTLLLLDSGEMGVVISHSVEKEQAFPQIVLLVKNERGELSKGDVVDIGENNAENGPYKRNIVKSINPGTYGIKPAQFII